MGPPAGGGALGDRGSPVGAEIEQRLVPAECARPVELGDEEARLAEPAPVRDEDLRLVI